MSKNWAKLVQGLNERRILIWKNPTVSRQSGVSAYEVREQCTNIPVVVQIKAEFPWFFPMCALVANRPSRIPTGLGNADTSIDTSLLLSGDVDDLTGSSEPQEKQESESEGAEEAREGDISTVSGDEMFTSRKRRAMDSKEDVKPLQSDVPSKKFKPAATKPAKSKTFLDKYAEVAEQEELTAQKQAKAVKARASVAAIRAQAKAQIRLEKEKRETEKERRKTEYALRKLELEHQYRLAQLSHASDPSSSTYHGASSSASPALPMLPHPDYPYPSTPHDSSGGSHSTTFNFSGM